MGSAVQLRDGEAVNKQDIVNDALREIAKGVEIPKVPLRHRAAMMIARCLWWFARRVSALHIGIEKLALRCYWAGGGGADE